MHTMITRRLLGGAALLAVAGCGGAAATNSGAGSPTTQGSASNATVASATVSGHGAVLVAGASHMTLYQFDKDIPGSGRSACTAACIAKWPPLTVPAGGSPTAASGITGQWGTITRTDGMGTQVTYNGLPLYFFTGDSKPGDANGNYPHWASVAAASSGAGSATSAPASVPSPTAAGGGYGY
jgi:predicted lipoprotein with Yx(FWY)xxD motif